MVYKWIPSVHYCPVVPLFVRGIQNAGLHHGVFIGAVTSKKSAEFMGNFRPGKRQNTPD